MSTCTNPLHDEQKRPLVDARNIFCCYVCPTCESIRRTFYRAEIFEDPNYWTDEPVEPDL